MNNNTMKRNFEIALGRFHNDHWNIKFPILATSMTLIFICFISLSGIVYMELSGIKDFSSKKNLINFLIASFSQLLLMWLVILFLPRWLQFALSLRNLPQLYCQFQSMLGSMFMVHYLLMLDSIVIAKYLFIFVLKNPLGLNDKLWNITINVATLSFSIISQILFSLAQNGGKHINYYICSAEDPSLKVTLPSKIRYGMFSLYIVSFLVYTVLPLKIWKLKRKIGLEESGIVQQDYDNSQKKFVFQILNYMMVVVFMTLLLVLVLVSARIDPFEIDKTGNILLLYFSNMIVPPMAVAIFCVGYYVRDSRLPKKLCRNFMTYILIKVLE